jgi:8-oxo-dGTP pyrophosphatase MutT (NUDIX family)
MASAWAVIEQEGKVLMVQRSARVSRPGQWCFPGGSLHRGERADAACVREVAEETGLEVSVLRCLGELNDQSYFLCAAAPGPVRLKANECRDHVWVAPEGLLGLGEIMNLRRVAHVLQGLGYRLELPRHLALDRS